jgi:hypothetical protein
VTVTALLQYRITLQTAWRRTVKNGSQPTFYPSSGGQLAQEVRKEENWWIILSTLITERYIVVKLLVQAEFQLHNLKCIRK